MRSVILMNDGQHRVAAQVRAKLAEANRRRGDVALIIDVSRSAASRKVNGHVPFTVEDLFAIAGDLGLNPSEFFRDTPASSLTS